MRSSTPVKPLQRCGFGKLGSDDWSFDQSRLQTMRVVWTWLLGMSVEANTKMEAYKFYCPTLYKSHHSTNNTVSHTFHRWIKILRMDNSITVFYSKTFTSFIGQTLCERGGHELEAWSVLYKLYRFNTLHELHHSTNLTHPQHKTYHLTWTA